MERERERKRVTNRQIDQQTKKAAEGQIKRERET